MLRWSCRGWKRRWFGIAIVLACLILVGCGKKENQKSNDAVPSIAPSAETSEEPVVSPVPLEDIVETLRASMASNAGENFSLSQDDESIVVNVWLDGLGANVAAVDASSGIPEQWDTIIQSFQTMAKSVQDTLDVNGYQNIGAVFNVLNDLNKSELLISVSRDSVMYDFVRGIDLIKSAGQVEKQEALKALLSDGYVRFSQNVADDVTGRSRLLLYSSGEDILDHIVDYYQAFFADDSEVHVVVNLWLKTTTVITASGGGGFLYVRVHEYVDKEEHSAKTLASGMSLKSYLVNLSTGEIEDMSS